MAEILANGGWDLIDGQSSIRPPVLIIGLGNPILGDDGIGWRVVEQIAGYLQPSPVNEIIFPLTSSLHSGLQVEVDCLAVGGLALMERLIGYERVIIVDALSTRANSPGAITQALLSDLPDRAFGHLCSAHDTTLQNALKVGKEMGAKLPGEIIIVGIEAAQIYDFSTELTPELLDSIPRAVELVMELINDIP